MRACRHLAAPLPPPPAPGSLPAPPVPALRCSRRSPSPGHGPARFEIRSTQTAPRHRSHRAPAAPPETPIDRAFPPRSFEGSPTIRWSTTLLDRWIDPWDRAPSPLLPQKGRQRFALSLRQRWVLASAHSQEMALSPGRYPNAPHTPPDQPSASVYSECVAKKTPRSRYFTGWARTAASSISVPQPGPLGKYR
jgi:hypothetical protein